MAGSAAGCRTTEKVPHVPRQQVLMAQTPSLLPPHWQQLLLRVWRGRMAQALATLTCLSQHHCQQRSLGSGLGLVLRAWMDLHPLGGQTHGGVLLLLHRSSRWRIMATNSSSSSSTGGRLHGTTALYAAGTTPTLCPWRRHGLAGTHLAAPGVCGNACLALVCRPTMTTGVCMGRWHTSSSSGCSGRGLMLALGTLCGLSMQMLQRRCAVPLFVAWSGCGVLMAQYCAPG
jgi:hypothetical protein